MTQSIRRKLSQVVGLKGFLYIEFKDQVIFLGEKIFNSLQGCAIIINCNIV